MNDYIERQDAIDTHCAICPDKDKCPDGDFICPDRELFRMIKPVYPEPPKMGKWEERKVFSARAVEDLQSARCSACGLYHTTPYLYFFDTYAYCPNCGMKMKDADQQLPPTQSGWIPCSERLPDYDVEVLATTEWGGITIAERNEPRTGEKDYWWFLAEGNINGEKDDVIAWMPRPEPYKEGNDGTAD